MDLDVAARAEVVAVLDDVENLFVLLLDLNAYLINFEGFHSLVEVGQRIEVVATLVERVSDLPKVLSLNNPLLLELKNFLAK